jgi:hypothetical protein
MTLKGFSFTRYRQTYNRLSDDVDQSFGNLLCGRSTRPLFTAFST